MKRIFYTLIILLAVGLSSCKKGAENQTIKEFDENQIQGYILQNHLTNMQRDKSNGDTTGIYYEILSKGTGPVIDYPDKVSYVYSFHTFDNEYSTTDTIANHTNGFLGHVTPNAIQLSLKNIAQTKGTKVRLLIPSRLAFGRDGYFAGAIHINGNECLDYTINLIDQDYDPVKKINYQSLYDDISIQKYMAANNLTGFTKSTKSGLWYKETTVGTGVVPTINSVVGVQYTGYLFNNAIFDQQVNDDATVAAYSTSLYSVITGWQEGLTHAHVGSRITLLVPSALAYGDPASSSIPAFSCLRFDILLVSVTN
ncbi:FKBP-type peptidyl-prolyl cis-trans isomerase [Mucilaginibacter sp. HMF5004]|uniref:FKBP-type peptidyl-prolyl cis-trans isomerase n=1 Tax=Mucilaginibacter rivuli TaxID=2857527 RepID=UPI001C5CFB39|nr:FKBP-type peptidyl-prolyl cis-trans isomerase [Mucilaginibacter rivuli]MBW4888637.1 FKBP-type peptidyl-prolyl cis-trans isomerase [Mucilaginibacter rivuli]